MKTFSQFLIEETQSPLNQQIEYYETTLSYLVNEGYAETLEEAEDIYLNLDEASRSRLSNEIGKLAWKATKAGAKLAWKGAKAATKAVGDYGSYFPIGSKRRAVSDIIDKVRWATLSDAEKTRRRNAVHRSRNTRQGRAELAARQKKSQEVGDRWHEQQRKRQERRRARTGRYRNVGAGSRESVREMKTYSEFIAESFDILERYYEPDEKLPSDRTPNTSANSALSKAFKNRQDNKTRQRAKNLVDKIKTDVRHGADNPNPNPHVSRNDKKEVKVTSNSDGIVVHHKPSGIAYSVQKTGDPSANNMHTIEWDHNQSPKTKAEKIKIARNAEKVWNKHVSHRLPHNAVAHNSPLSSGSDDLGNELRNRRERLYSKRGGFGPKDSEGDQFAKVGRNPSPKQQEKGQKRLSPIEPRHLHRHTRYDE